MSEIAEPFPRTLAVLRGGIERGLHLGAQLYVSLLGQPVADLAVGEIQPGVPMRGDTISPWLSAVKPIAAVAIAQLWERGKLDLDDRVAVHIPEFATAGKDAVTIRHLLTHTAGFRAAIVRWDDPWETNLARVLNAPQEPDWSPGRRAGYHVHSAWTVLGELVHRLDDRRRTYDDYVRRQIFEPLGMLDSWTAMPADVYDRYTAGNRLGYAYNTSKGFPDDPESGHPSKQHAMSQRPGGNGRGPVRELARFYEMLLGKGALGNARILSPQSVEALTARQRVGMRDETFKAVMDWGLGFIIDSKQYAESLVPYGYGPHASPRTFGHSGYECSCAFADPEHHLAAAWVCNGMPGDARHQQRQHSINTAIYEDLVLVPAPS